MMHSESGHDRYICGQWIGKRAKQALPSALMQDRLDAGLSSEGCGAQHCERSKWAELPMVAPCRSKRVTAFFICICVRNDAGSRVQLRPLHLR
jgi:hypothetical protein